MRRSQIEKLRTVSVRGELYVHVGELLDAQKAEEEEAKAAEAETQTPRKAAEKPQEK